MIEALRAGDSSYDDKIAFVYVDWDTYGRQPISRDLRVSRQSTLVMLSDGGEVGRLVAQTAKATIKDLLDKGVTSAPAGAGAACAG